MSIAYKKKRNFVVIAAFALIMSLTLVNCSGGEGGGAGGTNPSPTYTVTYDGNGSTGGSVPVDAANYEQGQTVTVVGNTGSLVKTGYSFAGWNTQADGNGTTYTQSQAFVMGTVNVTLYAKWTTNPTYTVTYNGNGNTGGSVPMDTTNYEQGQTVTVLGNTGNLMKTGYTFAGWNTLADGTGTTYAQAQSFAMGAAHVTVYAKWSSSPVLATVTTTAISSITGTTATSGGNVTDDGGVAIIARGICWSTSVDPTISGSHTTDGTGIGIFTSALAGLTADTTYHVRAYATNSAGTAYGNSLNFKTAPAATASGSLDSTFGTGGKATTAVGSGNHKAYAIRIQPDGKIVAAGKSNNDFALVRYNTDGTLDTTFGTGGIVTTAIGSSIDVAYAIRIQSDGKIVAAGVSSNGSNYKFALVRYNTDGTLDTTFGSGGKVTTAIGSGDDIASALGIQSDGKIVAAGSSADSSNFYYTDFALVRYNTNGTLDATFGTGGKATTAIGTWNDSARALSIQSDGKLVAAGNADKGWHDFALVRYNTDGTLDTTFGTGGKVTTGIGTGNDYATALGIQTNGRILAAGFFDVDGNFDLALAQYNTDGTLDTSFGTGGKVTTAIGSGYDEAHAIGIQSDGKILAAGYSYNGSEQEDFILVRYNTDGTLDTSFGTSGVATTDVGNYGDIANALAIQSDGKIVAAGDSALDNNNNYYDFAVVRYLP